MQENIVYSRHTTGKQSAETAEASLLGEQSGTTPSTSMNAPTQSSEGKGSEKSDTRNGNHEKKIFARLAILIFLFVSRIILTFAGGIKQHQEQKFSVSAGCLIAGLIVVLPSTDVVLISMERLEATAPPLHLADGGVRRHQRLSWVFCRGAVPFCLPEKVLDRCLYYRQKHPFKYSRQKRYKGSILFIKALWSSRVVHCLLRNLFVREAETLRFEAIRFRLQDSWMFAGIKPA
ncbi:MAG: hypothetical protein IKS94_00445 [Prevotella sp.]|nr:hypothetical protein [Prevotella sp.]